MSIKKVFAPICALAFVIGAYQLNSNQVEARGNDLAVMLPESEGVVILDSKRLVTDALPQVLSSNSHVLGKIDFEIDKFKAKTGLDLRNFDNVAIGLNYKEIAGKTEFDAVVLARGSVDTGSLEAVARTASDGNFRTETVESRKLYIFSAKKLIDSNRLGRARGTFLEGVISKLFNGLSDEVALTAYDSTTVALGSYERVKATISNSPRISNELLGLLDRKPTALANLGMTFPTGMSQFLELEDDELGANLDSIREMQASIDINDGTTSISVAAKSAEAAKAENLAFTLKALKGLAAGVFRENKNADKQAYSRMLENVEVSHNDKHIFVDVSVAKSDLDVIIGKK